ncbi:MAG: hypothetical protein IPG64_19520 [Haliea sp.]|nr:hypothetical protein [Haliea sp.]
MNNRFATVWLRPRSTPRDEQCPDDDARRQPHRRSPPAERGLRFPRDDGHGTACGVVPATRTMQRLGRRTTPASSSPSA